MEVPGSCYACGEERMVLDAIHGVLACDACGRVGNQAETELRSEWQTGHVIERRGTYVGDGDSGAIAGKCLMGGQTSHSFLDPGNSRSRDRQRLETMKKVEGITALLRVPRDKVNDAKQLLEATLDGEWGTGRWVDVLVAACIYIVIRQSQLPLTVPEVADSVNCDVVELGRMYNRVLQKLEISLPIVDLSVFLERAASTLPAVTKLGKDVSRKITKQGTMLLDYVQKCFIATGRRQLPVAAAVLSLVVEANKVDVDMAEVATQLHAGLAATKRRYKECQTALIGIGQSLPWGKDITLKTVPRHLSFLLQAPIHPGIGSVAARLQQTIRITVVVYLELKTKLEKKKKVGVPSGGAFKRGPSLAHSTNEQVPSFAPQTSVAGTASTQATENDTHITSAEEQPCSSKYYIERIASGPKRVERSGGNGDGVIGPGSISSNDFQPNIATSDDLFDPLSQSRPAKVLKMTGASFRTPRCGYRGNEDAFTEPVLVSASDDVGPVQGMHETTELNLSVRDSTRKSRLQMAPEAPWKGLPASFCSNLEARTRRQVKIHSAKSRISEARRALTHRFGKALFLCDSPEPIQNDQEKLKLNAEPCNQPSGSLDGEDLLIEHLILSGASEAELEDGYYQSLLAIYPEQSNMQRMDDDPASYIRSRSEIKLLLELRGD